MTEHTSRKAQAQLLQALHDEDLSEAAFARLESLLANNEELRWQYIHDVHLRSGLQRWAKSRGVASAQSLRKLLDDAMLSSHVASGNSETLDPLANETPSVVRLTWLNRLPSLPMTIGAAVLTATLLFGLFGKWVYPPDESSDARTGSEPLLAENSRRDHDQFSLGDSRSVVARVVWATADATWSQDNGPSDFLMRLRPGDDIGVESGLVKIEFSDGALVLLHPSSLLQVTSATSARLIRGQIAGRAQNGNFTLSTPSATVVDIGTEFGVGVNKDGTRVTVFEGEVHVHGVLSSMTAGTLRRLTQGMSLSIDSHGTPSGEYAGQKYRREFVQRAPQSANPHAISLLDLIGGYDEWPPMVAGSIDPTTGFWGRPPWADPSASRKRRGDTQFTPTSWNAMVDGVFIPRSNAREMQIDSDGHMVYLPPNSGVTWGPIWARRRSELDLSYQMSGYRNDAWGDGKLRRVLDRLSSADTGILGLHANVGITFDLQAVRSATKHSVDSLEALVANLGEPLPSDGANSYVDLRIFVDGKLRHSRIAFSPPDGEEAVTVLLDDSDRFVTIVATDAGGDPSFDHAVLVDPIFRFQHPN